MMMAMDIKKERISNKDGSWNSRAAFQEKKKTLSSSTSLRTQSRQAAVNCHEVIDLICEVWRAKNQL